MNPMEHPSNFRTRQAARPEKVFAETPSAFKTSSRRLRFERAADDRVWVEHKSGADSTDGAVLVTQESLAKALAATLGWSIDTSGPQRPEPEPEVVASAGFAVDIEARNGLTSHRVSGASDFRTIGGEVHVLDADGKKLYVAAVGEWRSAAKVAA